jgi:hypothetical protein
VALWGLTFFNLIKETKHSHHANKVTHNNMDAKKYSDLAAMSKEIISHGSLETS